MESKPYIWCFCDYKLHLLSNIELPAPYSWVFYAISYDLGIILKILNTNYVNRGNLEHWLDSCIYLLCRQVSN